MVFSWCGKMANALLWKRNSDLVTEVQNWKTCQDMKSSFPKRDKRQI